MTRASERKKGVETLVLAGGAVIGISLGSILLREILGWTCSPLDKLPLDPFAPLAPYTCDPVAKPGVERFRDYVLKRFGGGDLGIINRACGQTGQSDHDRGGAWDWATLSGYTAEYKPAQRVACLRWLLGADCLGRSSAMARRAGLTYVLWQDKCWRSYRTYWAAAGEIYTIPPGVPEHLNHVHFSFGDRGAAGKTSLYKAI